jgi:hypothetical protein
MSTATQPPEVIPSLADVAALIRARTKDSNGNELGTFTAATRPTDAQAQEAIDHAVAALGEKVGIVAPPCTDVARMAAAYGAAAEIELSYFPEQARADRSPYQFLLARWQQALEGTRECVLGNVPGAGTGGTPASGFGLGTITARSGVAYDFYTGDMGLLSDLPEPEPPPGGGDVPIEEATPTLATPWLDKEDVRVWRVGTMVTLALRVEPDPAWLAAIEAELTKGEITQAEAEAKLAAAALICTLPPAFCPAVPTTVPIPLVGFDATVAANGEVLDPAANKGGLHCIVTSYRAA